MTRSPAQPTRFPVRLHKLDRVEVIRLPRPMGGPAKVWLREQAKALPEYHQAIVTGISGRTDSGQEIPINTVGRWLFGTPGYMGHVRVSNWEGQEAKVEWPAQSPDVVHTLITKLKTRVEGEVVRETSSKDVSEQAILLVRERRPHASLAHKAAFANSVLYLVTGESGGFGGPSVREHAAARRYGDRQWSFEEAVKVLLREDGVIFGPLTDLHRACWKEEHCFDNDPVDVEALES